MVCRLGKGEQFGRLRGLTGLEVGRGCCPYGGGEWGWGREGGIAQPQG